MKKEKKLKGTPAKAPSIVQSHFSDYSSIYSKNDGNNVRAFKIIQSLLFKTSNMHYCLHAPACYPIHIS